MIVFVPGYDPATEANLAVARRLVGVDCRYLFAHDATSGALLEALRACGSPLFAMSHGDGDRLFAQGGAVALSVDLVHEVGTRPVFAFACKTGAELGEAASRAGATWWGYTGKITAPGDHELVLPIFERLFRRVCEAFPAATDAAGRQGVFADIAEACREAEARLDELYDSELGLEIMSSYSCVSQVWKRLRVWAHGLGSPEMHPEAPPPILVLD